MLDREGRRHGQRLVDDAVTLGEREQGLEVITTELRVELEAEMDLPEAHGCLGIDGHGPAKVKLTLGSYPTAGD